jgi:hypothetical protein
MNWDEAMDSLLILLHSGKLSDKEYKAVDKVLDFDWGNAPDGKSVVERASDKPKAQLKNARKNRKYGRP